MLRLKTKIISVLFNLCCAASHLTPVSDLTITVLALILFVPLALCGEDEAIQLTAQEVALLFQLLDALLQPGILLQGDVEVSSQV